MFITKKKQITKNNNRNFINIIFIEVYFDQMDHNRLDSMAKWWKLDFFVGAVAFVLVAVDQYVVYIVLVGLKQNSRWSFSDVWVVLPLRFNKKSKNSC
jgi:hypothetical protein